MEEFKTAVFEMAANKAAEPDGFNAEFYQKNWELVKQDLFGLLKDFQKGELGIARLNYGVITLVPKGKVANMIQKYRPICLLNVSFKIITRVLVNRLIQVIWRIVLLNQTAFIKGRYIMEGVNILHEILNDTNKKKKSSVLFKIDFEKAFDKVKWPFLHQSMEAKGFTSKWIDLIMKTVTSGKVGINVNGEIGANFSTYQGVRQGDPLSPILFDLAVFILDVLVKRAREKGLQILWRGVWLFYNMQMTPSSS
jgi:hypothetical protein